MRCVQQRSVSIQTPTGGPARIDELDKKEAARMSSGERGHILVRKEDVRVSNENGD